MTENSDASQANSKHSKTGFWKLALLFAVTAILTALVMGKVAGMNGPAYWRWPWKQIAAPRFCIGMFLAAIPLIIALFLRNARKISLALALMLLMITCLLFQVVALGMESDPFELTKIMGVVVSPGASGYFLTANLLVGEPDWLENYPELMPTLASHVRTKPPGIVLYNLGMIRLFGFNDPAQLPKLPMRVQPEMSREFLLLRQYDLNHAAALISGLVVGILATLCIPATYWLLKILGAQRDAAFCGAVAMTICPAVVVFFPEFDQVYPVLTCAMIGLWVLALDRNQLRYSAAFGCALALACLFAYNFLVLGIFLLGFAILRCLRQPRISVTSVLKHSGIAIAVFVILYVAMWAFTGFDPVAAFKSALASQAEALKHIARPYPATILFDLTDFAMGASWVGFLLAGYYMLGLMRQKQYDKQPLVWLALGQIFAVAICGLLPGETIRVWLFMYPLLMLPIGLELAKWSFNDQLAGYACMWLLMCAIAQNMTFIGL